MSEVVARGEKYAEGHPTADGNKTIAAAFDHGRELRYWVARRWWQIALIVIALIALRVVYIWHYRIDSDEPQHLHVVWGWTRGLLPYRDIFDNHAPLFQALCAPLFWLLGVRADIILPMRLAMLPLYLATIFCVVRIVATFSTLRVAVWSGALTALFPPLVLHANSFQFEFPSYFLSSIEFRPDQLWTALWMMTLAVLVSGRPTPRRAFAAGLLLGADFTVSMKSVLMLGALACAILHTYLATRESTGAGRSWPALAKCAAAALLGLVIVPAMVILVFLALGAGKEFYDCVVRHNITSGDANSHAFYYALLRLARWVPVAIIGSLLIARTKSPAPARSRLCFCFLATTYYWAFLWSGWPVLTDEDFLPLSPTLGLVAGPLIIWIYDAGLRAVRIKTTITVFPVLLAECAALLIVQWPGTDQTRDKIGLVADTLRLTTDDDYVMDAKGETIYRRRAFYYVLERMALWRLKNGKIPDDDIIGRLIDTKTPLVTTRRMPKETIEFMKGNYLPIAWRLRVLGQEFPPRNFRPHGPIVFKIRIPARYSFVSSEGPVEGKLDGMEITGPCELSAGRHEFLPSPQATGKIAMIWSAALERGYSPFAPIKKDYTTPQD